MSPPATQLDDEGAALAGDAGEHQAAAVELGQLMRHGHAEAGAVAASVAPAADAVGDPLHTSSDWPDPSRSERP